MGGWAAVFGVAAALNVLAAMLVFALIPARSRLVNGVASST
jgi:hypothetical protein